MEDSMKTIGQSLGNFQAALKQEGSSLEEFIRRNYCKKWISDEMYHVTAVRTALVQACTDFLAAEGLHNIEKVDGRLMPLDPNLPPPSASAPCNSESNLVVFNPVTRTPSSCIPANAYTFTCSGGRFG